MRRRILDDMRFRGPKGGWDWPAEGAPGFEVDRGGVTLSAAVGKDARLAGPGVHTRNGDSIALHFRVLERGKGRLRFGFSGGFETAMVTLDFRRRTGSLSTTEWTRPQPVERAPLRLGRGPSHLLVLERTEGAGRLVKKADVAVSLDGRPVLRATDLDVLPEMGVLLSVSGTRILAERFVHRGVPSGVPEYLHVGGWQVLNRPSLEENLASIKRGLRAAAEAGVQLLVTPETCLTGLFPLHKVTRDPKAVAAAERNLQRFMRSLEGSPHLIIGLPEWRSVPGHRLKTTRYNVCRVYDPDGGVLASFGKIHSCEPQFHHAYRLHECDIEGVPVSLHICHDGRYPEVWTLPAMFGARLVLQPSNGGQVGGTIDAFEAGARRTATTSHAFYLRVNGLGGSCLVGPQKYDNLVAVSAECRRDVPSFPLVGEPQECLFHSNIRIHDAFGHWPVRSFRASEEIAESYVALYRAWGGTRGPAE